MQITSINNAYNIAKTNQNYEVSKAPSQEDIEKSKLRKEVENILKDVSKDEWGTYDPHGVEKLLAKYDEGSKIYEELSNELLKGILTYGEDPNATMLSNEELFSKIPEYADAITISLFLKIQPKLGIQNDTMYQRIYQRNDADAISLREFINEFEINDFDLSGEVFKIPEHYADDIMELFADEKISIDEFKKSYLELRDKINNEYAKAEEREKPFKAIEVKGSSVRENINDFFSKIDPNKIKNDKDLLAIYLAYKNGDNIYEKWV